MKKASIIIIALTAILASAFTILQPVNYKVKEEGYNVSFKGGKVEGIFKGLKASILFDELAPETSKIIATIDATTLETGSGMMNKHAKAENALNVKAYTVIGFESISISGKSGVYEALGKLTLKGVTKEVKLPFTLEHKGAESLFKGKLNIAPKDYNITRMGTPDVLEIDLIIPVTKAN